MKAKPKIAIVKTKDNRRNLNGKPLKVMEIARRRVSCQVFDEEIQRPVTIEFKLKEVVEFN